MSEKRRAPVRSKPMKQRLTDLTGAVYAGICSMTPRQRTAALKALDKLSETNCSWIVYRARHLLRDLIQCRRGHD